MFVLSMQSDVGKGPKANGHARRRCSTALIRHNTRNGQRKTPEELLKKDQPPRLTPKKAARPAAMPINAQFRSADPLYCSTLAASQDTLAAHSAAQEVNINIKTYLHECYMMGNCSFLIRCSVTTVETLKDEIRCRPPRTGSKPLLHLPTLGDFTVLSCVAGRPISCTDVPYPPQALCHGRRMLSSGGSAAAARLWT